MIPREIYAHMYVCIQTLIDSENLEIIWSEPLNIIAMIIFYGNLKLSNLKEIIVNLCLYIIAWSVQPGEELIYLMRNQENTGRLVGRCPDRNTGEIR